MNGVSAWAYRLKKAHEDIALAHLNACSACFVARQAALNESWATDENHGVVVGTFRQLYSARRQVEKAEPWVWDYFAAACGSPVMVLGFHYPSLHHAAYEFACDTWEYIERALSAADPNWRQTIERENFDWPGVWKHPSAEPLTDDRWSLWDEWEYDTAMMIEASKATLLPPRREVALLTTPVAAEKEDDQLDDDQLEAMALECLTKDQSRLFSFLWPHRFTEGKRGTAIDFEALVERVWGGKEVSDKAIQMMCARTEKRLIEHGVKNISIKALGSRRVKLLVRSTKLAQK